jgi:hypothetical protein
MVKLATLLENKNLPSDSKKSTQNINPAAFARDCARLAAE